MHAPVADIATTAQTIAWGAEIARSAGFDAYGKGVTSMPTWQGIVDAEDELDAPLIVIEGSLSHQAAAKAGRPLMVVPSLHDEA
jgi:hypothetical protein